MHENKNKEGQPTQHPRGRACTSRTIATIALGLVLSSPLPAANFELSLRLEDGLKKHGLETPVPTEMVESAPAEEPLALKSDKGLGPEAPAEKDPAEDVVSETSTADTSSLWHYIVRLFWLATAAFLLAHILREWGKVILVRLRREQKPVVLEHARWPTVSILVMPKGDASTQEKRLDALSKLPFDYPAERIHFLVAYHTHDIGVRDAIHRLGKALPEKVQALELDEETRLAALLPEALERSVGAALVILDQNLPVPRDWLRNALSPLMDPAVGVVLSRAIPGQIENVLATRLLALADHADALLANQADAIDLMLCGKARIRALSRSACKALEDKAAGLTPDGASLVLELVRTGRQACLLSDDQGTTPVFTNDTVRSPRLHPGILLQALRLAPQAFSRDNLQGVRQQARMVFFAAILPVIWLLSLASGILLYVLGDIVSGSLALALCTATSFDPLGHPRPAFSLAASARMAGIREEIRILPLTSLSFLDKMLEACHEALKARHALLAGKNREEDPILFADKGGAA